jgi:hypothetical protein
VRKCQSCPAAAEIGAGNQSGNPLTGRGGPKTMKVIKVVIWCAIGAFVVGVSIHAAIVAGTSTLSCDLHKSRMANEIEFFKSASARIEMESLLAMSTLKLDTVLADIDKFIDRAKATRDDMHRMRGCVHDEAAADRLLRGLDEKLDEMQSIRAQVQNLSIR